MGARATRASTAPGPTSSACSGTTTVATPSSPGPAWRPSGCRRRGRPVTRRPWPRRRPASPASRAGSARSATVGRGRPSSTTASRPTCCPPWPPSTPSAAVGWPSWSAGTTGASTTARWPRRWRARGAPTLVLTLPDSGPRIRARRSRTRRSDRHVEVVDCADLASATAGRLRLGPARRRGPAVPGRSQLRAVPRLRRAGRRPSSPRPPPATPADRRRLRRRPPGTLRAPAPPGRAG